MAQEDLHIRHLESESGISFLGELCKHTLQETGRVTLILEEDGSIALSQQDGVIKTLQILELLDDLEPKRALQKLLKWGTTDVGCIEYLQGRDRRRQELAPLETGENSKPGH